MNTEKRLKIVENEQTEIVNLIKIMSDEIKKLQDKNG